MSPSVNLPVTLTANTPENVADLNANLNAIIAALNGGLDEVNVPNLTAAFTSYKPPSAVAFQEFTAGTAAGTYLLLQRMFTAGSGPVAVGAATALPSHYLIELDPARYAANARITKLRLSATAVANAVAPAITFTIGLYPVATFGGASGASPIIATLGAAVSTVAIASPPAGRTKVDGTDFNFPAAGAYVLAVALSGTQAAGANTDIIAWLDLRQV